MHMIEDEPFRLKDSALWLFVGNCVGSGASRRVYELHCDPESVIKLEHSGKTFHNQTEWLVWQDVKGWPIADWFAPCLDIDGYGNVLRQKKTVPFKNKYDFHAAITRTRGGVIPKVFDDVHYGNFGMLNGLVTCHDYGYHRFFEQIAREMSVDAGYIKYDDPESPPLEPFDVTDGGQLALDL